MPTKSSWPWPGTGRVHVGHGQPGARDTEAPSTDALHPSLRRLPRASEEAQPRCGVTLGGVKSRGTLVPRVRQAPDGRRKVVPNPRISAGSPVGSDWLRLFRWTKGKTMMKT